MQHDKQECKKTSQSEEGNEEVREDTKKNSPIYMELLHKMVEVPKTLKKG